MWFFRVVCVGLENVNVLVVEFLLGYRNNLQCFYTVLTKLNLWPDEEIFSLQQSFLLLLFPAVLVENSQHLQQGKQIWYNDLCHV